MHSYNVATTAITVDRTTMFIHTTAITTAITVDRTTMFVWHDPKALFESFHKGKASTLWAYACGVHA